MHHMLHLTNNPSHSTEPHATTTIERKTKKKKKIQCFKNHKEMAPKAATAHATASHSTPNMWAPPPKNERVCIKQRFQIRTNDMSTRSTGWSNHWWRPWSWNGTFLMIFVEALNLLFHLAFLVLCCTIQRNDQTVHQT